MAINKTVNKSTMSHGTLANCISYVLREDKIIDGLVCMTGPAPEKIDSKSVYKSFINEKKIWGKDSGRMYNHNIISFHKNEAITPEEALAFGREFAGKWFSNYQTLVAVHQDKDHVHIHLITNTVSYRDGRKLHNSKADLQAMKDFTNRMCIEKNLSVTQKGKHFDNTEMEKDVIVAWKKSRYIFLLENVQRTSSTNKRSEIISTEKNNKTAVNANVHTRTVKKAEVAEETQEADFER